MFEAIILGIIQGITEFIPISSSGHLLIAEKILGVEANLSFDVFLHFATALAILFFFRKDVWTIITEIPAFFRSLFRGKWKDLGQLLLSRVLIGAIPAGVVGLLVADFVDANLRLTSIATINIILFGLLLGWADRRLKNPRTDNSKLDFFWIGLSQILAFVPGVSRSGITITTGLFRNLSREQAARLSFLIGLPLILAAGSKGLIDIVNEPPDGLAYSLVAGLTAFIVGILSLKVLMKIIKARSLMPFVVYRVIVGLLIGISLIAGIL